MVVILLGVGYVSYSMTAQTPSDTTPMPKSPVLSPQAKEMLDAKANPYVGQLLAPRTAGVSSTASGTATSSALSSSSNSPYTSVNPQTAVAISSRIGIVDPAVKAVMDSALTNAEKCYSSGDTSGGVSEVNMGLIYFSGHPGLPITERIDLLICGTKLCHKANNFDRAREYVNEAQKLSAANGDYQMDTIEGLRLILLGHEAEATNFNSKLSAFNSALSNSSQQSQLSALADDVVAAAAKLPEDSPFRQQAQECKAKAQKLATGQH